MTTFKYRSRGTNNEDWQLGTIEAESKEDAIKKLDDIFGISRDSSGRQITKNVIVELIKEDK